RGLAAVLAAGAGRRGGGQDDVDVSPRVARILRRARYRRQARTRLYAERAKLRGRRGRDLGKRRAGAVAGSRRARTGAASRARSRPRGAAIGRTVVPPLGRRRRYREGRARLSARRPKNSRGTGYLFADRRRGSRLVARAARARGSRRGEPHAARAAIEARAEP